MYTHKYIDEVNMDLDIEQISSGSRFVDLFAFLDHKMQTRENVSYLDYGCGADAETLIFAKKIGYIAQGVELTQSAREEAGSCSGCDVLSPSELFKSNLKFDTIFLGDVIEHIYNPIEILTLLKPHLKPGGEVFIQGPLEGASTFSHFLLAIKSYFTPGRRSHLPPYHVSLANFNAISLLLAASGYRIDWYRTAEPIWPAKRFFSKGSLDSISDFIFSFSKVVDISISKIVRHYGTRIYLVAKLK
jgi:SAM-dependent methyltransferase